MNSEYHKQYYQLNKEKLVAQNKLWADNNRERYREMSRNSYHKRKLDAKNIVHYLLKYAKSRATKKGLPFTLIESDIVLPNICPILGVTLDKNHPRYTYSIDRIDNTKGYTKDNIQIISRLANAMKWDSTHEERLAFANWVLSSEKGVLL